MNTGKPLTFELPICIVGLGISGNASLRLLQHMGVLAKDILSFDDKNPSAMFNLGEQVLAASPKTLLVSPGVPLATPWIQSLIAQGCRLTSELELAFSFLWQERVIAITGSIGKSTVTEMIGCALRTEDPNCFVGGNLGTPLATYALGVASGKTRAQSVVLELSSFQLENFKNLSVDFSVITYLAPNHLERYRDLQDYYDVKLSLLKKTKGKTFLNHRGGDLFAQIKKPSDKYIWMDRESALVKNCLPCKILGAHNVDNLSLVAGLVNELGLGSAAYNSLKSFAGLSHRIENLGSRNNITLINDSKATAMDSVLVAVDACLEQLSQGGRLILLLGGRDKNLPWEELKTLQGKITPVYFGEYGAQARKRVQIEGACYNTLRDALENLRNEIKSGDTVLLSPGGSSLDEFGSFVARGEFFRTWSKSILHQS